MAYLNNIPTASQRLKDSQPELLENFATNSALLGVDHVISPWTNPATGNQGKHNQVTLPEQADDPATLTNEMKLYTKEVSGVSQLFIQPEGVLAGVDGTNITGATKATTGETTLPSGIILKWGRGVTAAGGEFTITFANAFTTIYVATATAASTTPQGHNEDQSVARIEAYSTTSVTVKTLRISAAGGTPLSAQFTWFAIGV